MFEQSFLLDRTVVRCFFSVGALEVYISLKFVFPPDLFTVCQCIIEVDFPMKKPLLLLKLWLLFDG